MNKIIGGRHSGKTTELIKACQKTNEEAGYNCAVIVTGTKRDAQNIYKMAQDMGYKDMPFPVSLEELKSRNSTGTAYKNVYVDELDYIASHLLNPLNLEGFTLNIDGAMYKEVNNEINRRG